MPPKGTTRRHHAINTGTYMGRPDEREDIRAGEEILEYNELWNRLSKALPGELQPQLDEVFMELGRARLRLKKATRQRFDPSD